MQYRYSGTSALRHFVILTQSTGIHSDTVIGTALRRACGASCIRLSKSTAGGAKHRTQELSSEHMKRA
jgi:hypothetical protein